MKKEFAKEDTCLVKGLSVIALLFYHLFENEERITALKVDYGPFPLPVFLTLSQFGNICVAVFVFLSAYGMTKGLREQKITLGESCRKAVFRWRKLTGNFVWMYCSVNLLWFYLFDYKSLYGEGWQGGLMGILDMLGLAALWDTPTLNMTWWYMKIAIIVIALVPFLSALTEKIGNRILFPALVLPAIFTLDEDFYRYFFVMVTGVAAAHGMWLEKLFQQKWNAILQAFTGVLLLFLCVIIRQNYVIHSGFLWLLDGWIAFVIVWFGGKVLSEIPGLRTLLVFLGKHSMNIYFVHTFFYMILYQDFIYSFRYAGLILVVLLLVCVAYSVILEQIKKYCRRLFIKRG